MFKDIIFWICTFLWLTSTLIYIFLSIIENEKFQSYLLQVWEKSDSKIKLSRKIFVQEISTLGLNALSGVYEKKNGKTSFFKLFRLSVILNILIFVTLIILYNLLNEGVVFSGQDPFDSDNSKNTFTIMQIFGLAFFAMLILLFNTLWDFISYKITKYFMKKLQKSGKIRFLMIDVLAMIFFYTVVIFALLFGFFYSGSIENYILVIIFGVLIIMSPAGAVLLSLPKSVLYFFAPQDTWPVPINYAFESQFDWMIFSIPAALSVAIPTSLFVLIGILLYNKWAFMGLHKTIEFLATPRLSALKKIVYFVSILMISMISILSYK